MLYQKGQLKNRLEKGDSKQSGECAKLIRKDFLSDKLGMNCGQ